MSNSIVTDKFRYRAVKSLESRITDVDESLYFFYGQSLPWSNEFSPDILIDTEQQENTTKASILAFKKINDRDVILATPKIEWTSETTYDSYSDSESLLNKSYYVITSDRRVYKCLDNNTVLDSNGNSSVGVSTIEPVHTSGSIKETDGYVWYYMYELSEALDRKFNAIDYTPVNTADAVNVTKGTIDRVDIKGDGEYVIYDLGSSYELDLLQIATDDKDDPYGLQVWLSTTGTSASDFTMILPSTGDLLITTTVGVNDAFDQYEITASARYVKLIGFGRFDSAGNQRQSPWNKITEIEFYGTSVLSIDTINLDNEIVLYPIPVKNMLYINNLDENFQSIKIYSMDGKELLEKKVTHSNEELSIDLSFLAKGTYMISLNKGINSITKMIVVD